MIEGIEVINISTGIGTEYGQWPHKMGLEPTFLRDGYFWNGGKSWYAHDWGSSGGVREKYSVYPIGDGERQKAKTAVQKEGAHDGTRTHVGMSERLDLIT